MLVTTQELLQRAQREAYAVVGFAVYNLETLQVTVETAERLRAPLILQTTPSTVETAGIEYLSVLAKVAADKASIPIALHLDHGDTLERVRLCLEHGYTSVMIDGSALPYEENVKLVREAVTLAHSRGVPVEAELGRVRGVEDNSADGSAEKWYTDPDLARDFVERTGVDSLAVAIGTAHGLYKREPKLDLPRLSAIRSLVSVPLVLHGASGVPDSAIREAIRLGIAKINIATEVKIPFAAALREFLSAHPTEYDPRKYFRPAKEAYAAVVEEKIRLAGADGRY
jgi:tagatose 1,6-diphosphate aldolase GatY/KbaY